MSQHLWNLNDRTVDMDPELHRIAINEGLSFDDKVRAACLMLEQRIRQSAGLEPHDFGTDLIKKAFGEGGVFESSSPIKAENVGLMNLFLGTVMYYRNPVSHRSMHHEADETLHVLSLINHLLSLLKKASSSVVNARNHIGFHEGNLSHRRDFRLDIDGDGNKELIILLTADGVIVDGEKIGHLLPIVLKQAGNGGYRRIPCEIATTGESMYGPVDVRLHAITGQSRTDFVAIWALGETQGGYFIFRYDGTRYVRVDRDITGFPEPYGGPSASCFTYHNAYKNIQFIDYDGDGQVEIIQRLGFSFEETWKNLAEQRQQTRSRVWKWDASRNLLTCVIDIEVAGHAWDD